MTALFTPLEGDTAIIQSGGVFKQLPLYSRNGFLFVGLSSTSFIRLKADGSTSKPNTALVHIETEFHLYQDKIGRLGTNKMPDAKKLIPDETNKLMLAA